MKKLILLLSFVFTSSFVWAQTPPPVSDGGILPGPQTEVITQTKYDQLSDAQKKDYIRTGTQVNADGTEYDVYAKNGGTYLVDKLIPGIANGFIMLLLIAGIIMLIMAGIMYVVSSGDSETTGRAKEVIMWTLIGVGVAVLSIAIVKFMINIDFVGP